MIYRLLWRCSGAFWLWYLAIRWWNASRCGSVKLLPPLRRLPFTALCDARPSLMPLSEAAGVEREQQELIPVALLYLVRLVDDHHRIRWKYWYISSQNPLGNLLLRTRFLIGSDPMALSPMSLQLSPDLTLPGCSAPLSPPPATPIIQHPSTAPTPL